MVVVIGNYGIGIHLVVWGDHISVYRNLESGKNLARKCYVWEERRVLYKEWSTSPD